MKKLMLVTLSILAIFSQATLASDNHAHNEVKKERKAEVHDDDHAEHKDEHGEEHANEKGHEEANNQVGPKKGILEAHKEKGFKLSPEAEKNFEIEKVKVNMTQLEIPNHAIVKAGEEVNLFRLREGFYSRIDFTEVKKNATTLIVTSKDLKPGDEVVVKGLGFLRMTEIAAFDGAPAGHSH